MDFIVPGISGKFIFFLFLPSCLCSVSFNKSNICLHFVSTFILFQRFQFKILLWIFLTSYPNMTQLLSKPTSQLDPKVFYFFHSEVRSMISWTPSPLHLHTSRLVCLQLIPLGWSTGSVNRKSPVAGRQIGFVRFVFMVLSWPHLPLGRSCTSSSFLQGPTILIVL